MRKDGQTRQIKHLERGSAWLPQFDIDRYQAMVPSCLI